MPAKAAFAATWLPWLIARVVTGLALWFARSEVTTLRGGNPKAVGAARDGLLSSDATWYRAIAAEGYGIAHQSLRFFPLFPLLARGLHHGTALPVGGSLLLVSNAAAFVVGMLVYHLTQRESGDARYARNAVWLICLAPPAYVFVMGYSESLFVLLSVATFLSIRSDRWWWAALWGFLAGTSRPIGVLLVLPVVIEAVRLWPAADWRARVPRVLAAVAPLVGLLAYLSWVAATYGGFLAPIRLQRYGVSRSVSDDPFVNVYRDARSALHGSHIGTALHLPWIAVAIFLCIVVIRRLPASYGAFAVAIVGAGLLGSNFASFERYALSAFPLAMGAATLLSSRRVEVPVLVACGVGLFGYALLAFLGPIVP